MIELIKEVYEKINNELNQKYNTKTLRLEVKEWLEREIPNSVIKCDEENNTPDVIDSSNMVAKVSQTENHQLKYYDLVFGVKINQIIQ